jgi:hypothetical protein
MKYLQELNDKELKYVLDHELFKLGHKATYVRISRIVAGTVIVIWDSPIEKGSMAVLGNTISIRVGENYFYVGQGTVDYLTEGGYFIPQNFVYRKF